MNLEIYIPELWKKQPEEIDCLSKSGGTMMGPLDMGNNIITGLSREYPPGDDEACRWGHIKEHVNNEHVKIDNSGIHVSNGKNVRINSALGGGPEIEMKQLSHNTKHALAGGIRIISSDGQKHYQLGWSTDDNLTLYRADSNGVTEVCKFTEKPLKPVISVWAACNGNMHTGAREWHFGQRKRASGVCNYPILADGNIIRARVAITYADGATELGPEVDIVEIVVNGQSTNYTINAQVKEFETPLQLSANDVIHFKSIQNVSRVIYATVNILIELSNL